MDDSEQTGPGHSRDIVLMMLQESMEHLQEEIDGMEPASREEERLQLQRRHELGYLANQYRKVKRDTDLDEMKRRLEVYRTEHAQPED